MCDEDRQTYFWRRAREAHDRAAHATDERVRLVHTELAIRYEQQARREAIASGDPPGPD